MNRRDFIAAVGSAVSWPVVGRAQQAMPIVAFVTGLAAPQVGSSEAERVRAFAKGFGETGYVDGQNVSIEYHWMDGRYDRLRPLMADLVRRRVAVIATPGSPPAALAAKATTATIPIVFIVADDPVKLGLVDSLARPGGNATGFNFFPVQLNAKRLALLHELVPTAVNLAVLVNPGNLTTTETTIRDLREAARLLGLQIQIFDATTVSDIDDAFATFRQKRFDALFVAPDQFFVAHRVQLVTLAARDKIPATYDNQDSVLAGGLMSYSTNVVEMFHQVGVYTGKILRGAKPADLPVVQSTRFEFVINTGTARALGIEVPPTLLTIADKVIE
jgi:putative tryptophan/tyrosine transport system substrate-binding protein